VTVRDGKEILNVRVCHQHDDAPYAIGAMSADAGRNRAEAIEREHPSPLSLPGLPPLDQGPILHVQAWSDREWSEGRA
jgi:hypothetical protein